MNEPELQTPVDTKILTALRGRGPAMFVSDLSLIVAGGQALDAPLAALETRGAVLVREFYWPDPHLEGEDLRIVGLIEASEGIDGIGRCIESLEATWSDWLASFQAEHRCS